MHPLRFVMESEFSHRLNMKHKTAIYSQLMGITSAANHHISVVINIKPKVNISCLEIMHPAMLYEPCQIPRSGTVKRSYVLSLM